MVEVDILITVRYDPSKVDVSAFEWAIDKLGECEVVSNMGFDWDDFSTSSKEVSRQVVQVSEDDDV